MDSTLGNELTRKDLQKTLKDLENDRREWQELVKGVILEILAENVLKKDKKRAQFIGIKCL